MKQNLFKFAILFLLLSINGFAQSSQPKADKILGLYWSPEKDAKIQITKKGTEYFGKFVWLDQPKRDVKNPDESLRSREVLGAVFLTNFSYKDENYINGKIYDPKNGNTYNCKMILAGNNLKVRGFIGISLFGRTENFKRID